MAQKRPQSLCQVHAQQSNADDTEGSFLQVRHNAIEPIAALANSKFALDNVSVTDILILLFLRLLRPFRILCRPSQGRPGQLDALRFAPGNGLPVPVNFVNENPLRIAAVLLTVALYGTEKISCFVVGIKGKSFDFGVSIHHADVQLGSEFCVRMGFPADDWPDPRLADADDTVRYHMDTVFVRCTAAARTAL